MNDFMELTSTENDVDFKVLIRKGCVISVVEIVNGGCLVNLSVSDNKEFVSYYKVKEDISTIRSLLLSS